MRFNFKFPAKQCLILLMMVAPATAYTNINATTLDNSSSSPLSQTKSVTSVWISQRSLRPNTVALLEAIADAEAHGLNPSNYQLESLEQQLDSFVKNSEHSGSYNHISNIGQRKKLEQNLQIAFESLAQDLGRGVLDGQKTQRELYRPVPNVDTNALIQQLNSGTSTVDELLSELTPSAPAYLALVEHMRLLLKQRDSAVMRTNVKYLEAMKADAHHPSVINLRARLKETGDLGADSRLGTYFGSDITEALIAVQAREGITTTGELNKSTVIALNATIDDDIQEVAINLERWRWMPRELGERHIMINIPSYNLIMMNGNQRIVDMDVVVGSIKNQTPLFSRGAQFIEVAPTWVIPASITNNEIIPLEIESPGHIDKERMDYFSWVNNKLVSVPRSAITPEDFLEKPFPYVLRQRSGKDNVLGDIKILMPNKYAIYMHDTQDKYLFAETDRAYSHGCIRLSDPFRLGSLLLQLDGKSPLETATILNKKKTTRVELDTKTPTHITYFTAWIDEDGKLNKRKDVYQHDKPVIAGLQAKQTLLTTLKNRPVTVLAKQ